ncbi:MAG: pseudaminic acid cytidylyltransferase [Helicobacteraceae bacterium]|jgi:N-acylneuraminate cytidylyltransferase|nr:pseudaminic acid cytidylyltransferase [Helicobacteraceae bacterium]
MSRVIAVIPARGGSKRVPRKNIRDFCGKPMIAYPIAAALESGIFERVIVSTDDPEIGEVAAARGAEFLLRPAKLADDFIGVVPVAAHAIQSLLSSGFAADFVCLIYATAPFVAVADLRNAYEILRANDADYALSIAEFTAPIYRALKMDDSSRVSSIWADKEQARSQDLPRAFHDAAHFVFGRAEAFLAGKSVFNSKTIGFLIEKSRAQDIDTIEDFERAELMYKAFSGL